MSHNFWIHFDSRAVNRDSNASIRLNNSRSLHISSQEDKIPDFELSKKLKIPDSLHINPKFLAFYKSLRKDNYYANELRDLYNSYFGTNFTQKGLAHILEIRTMFSNQRIRRKYKRLTIYAKIFY